MRVSNGVSAPEEMHDADGFFGKITPPLVGEVQAAGLTRAELEKDLEKRYNGKFFVHASITVKHEERYIFVGGEVRQPGSAAWIKLAGYNTPEETVPIQRSK